MLYNNNVELIWPIWKTFLRKLLQQLFCREYEDFKYYKIDIVVLFTTGIFKKVMSWGKGCRRYITMEKLDTDALSGKNG